MSRGVLLSILAITHAAYAILPFLAVPALGAMNCSTTKSVYTASQCCADKARPVDMTLADLSFDQYIASEFASSKMYTALLDQQSAEQLGYMNCKGASGAELWGRIVHDFYQTYLHRHPSIAEYKEVFVDATNCALKETHGAMEKAQEIVLKKMRVKMGMSPSNDLEGKKVVITGGSRGLGFALAVLAAEQGATVIVTSRSKDWYDWTKSAATGNTDIWDRTAPPTTSSVGDAATAWSVPATTLSGCSLNQPAAVGCGLFAKIAYDKGGVTMYKLPQDHVPFYWGITGFSSAVFDKIHHFESDVRSRSDLKKLIDVHMAAVFGENVLPDYVFYNAMTEGPFFPIPDYSVGTLDIYNSTTKDSTAEVIAATPHIRYNTKGTATSNLEFDMGIGVFMWMLREKFGTPIMTSTTHVFSSSGAAATPMVAPIELDGDTFDPLGVPFKSTYNDHYGTAKLRMVTLASNLRAEGWRTVSMQIMGNNGMVNYQWTQNFVKAVVPGMALEWGELPMAIDKIDSTGTSSDTGKWIGGMSATGYQMYHSLGGGGYGEGGWMVSMWSTAMRFWTNMKSWKASSDAVCWPTGFVLENKQDFGFAGNAYPGLSLNVWASQFPAVSANLDFSKQTSATFKWVVEKTLFTGTNFYRSAYAKKEGKRGTCLSQWAYDYEHM